MSVPLVLFSFGIFHVDEDTVQVSLGCEDGNNDGAVATMVQFEGSH